MSRFPLRLWLVVAAPLAWPVAASAQATIVYRCPGNAFTSSADISAKEAESRGCKPIEGAPITVIQSPRPRSQPVPATAAGGENRERVDASAQRARDSDARRILESELRREEESLAVLRRDFNNGEPERRGDERNYQKYLDRVAEMKAQIARKEADIAAIKREIAKLPAS